MSTCASFCGVRNQSPFAPLLLVALFSLFLAPASAQQSPSVPTIEPGADVMTLCTAWKLTTKAIELAAEFKSIAGERVDRARQLVEQCKAKTECSREERVNLEQEVREAGYQQAKAVELAATMEERKKSIRARLEELRGRDALERCGDT
jgi:hypothetical protein